MKNIKNKSSIGWKSKFIDLLIVIIGITIAFQLNNFNESNKSNAKESDYLKSFKIENKRNMENMSKGLELSKINKKRIDSLKQLLQTKNYEIEKIKSLATT